MVHCTVSQIQYSLHLINPPSWLALESQTTGEGTAEVLDKVLSVL